ncbi:MAG: thermonuclease family protein [Syntrophobacteraceae bacterium]
MMEFYNMITARRKQVAALSAILVLFIATQAHAWQGKVVGVSDGDTITVMHDGKGEKIRLYGVDCPESHQDYGQKAKQFTSELVFGKTVDVQPETTDRYGRTVGRVSLDGIVLNAELIKAGYAWMYRQYCARPECQDWEKLEALARDHKLALWSMPNPVPPWEFRHNGKPAASAMESPPTTPTKVASGQTSVVYHGNRSSHIFHRPGCRYYDCGNCTAEFKSREEAIAAGYRQCKVCKP